MKSKLLNFKQKVSDKWKAFIMSEDMKDFMKTNVLFYFLILFMLFVNIPITIMNKNWIALIWEVAYLLLLWQFLQAKKFIDHLLDDMRKMVDDQIKQNDDFGNLIDLVEKLNNDSNLKN